jgi:hypothetical protein
MQCLSRDDGPRLRRDQDAGRIGISQSGIRAEAIGGLHHPKRDDEEVYATA